MSVINMAVAKATGRNLRAPEPLTNEQTAELMIETVNICRQLRDEAHEHRRATEKNLRDFAAQMEKWLLVQNRHKKWTYKLVDGVFQREEGRLNTLVEEATLMIEELHKVAEEYKRQSIPVEREVRHTVAEKLNVNVPR